MEEKPAKPGRTMPQNDTSSMTHGAKLDRSSQAKIGQKLRAIYSEVVNEGVPDRFAELLRELDRNERSKS